MIRIAMRKQFNRLHIYLIFIHMHHLCVCGIVSFAKPEGSAYIHALRSVLARKLPVRAPF